MASPVNMTEAKAEASIQNSLRRIFESQKAKLGILYQVTDAEPSPEYEDAVKDIAETLGVTTTGGRRQRSNKTLKRKTARRSLTKRR